MVLLTQGTQLEPSKKNKPLTKYFLFSLGLLFFVCAHFFQKGLVHSSGLHTPFNALSWIPFSLSIGIGLYHIAKQKCIQYTSLTLILFTVAIFLSIPLLNPDTSSSSVMGRFVGLWAGFIFFCCLQQFPFSNTQKRWLLWFIIAAVLIETLFAYVQYLVLEPNNIFKYDTIINRPAGIFQQPNVMATFLVTGFAVASYLLAKQPIKYNNVLIVTLLYLVPILVLPIIFILASLIGWLTTLLSLLLLSPYMWKYSTKRRFLMWSIAIIIGFIGGATLAQLPSLNNDNNGINATTQVALISQKADLESPRHDAIPQALDMFLEKPIIGYGYGNFEASYVLYTAKQHQISSNYHPGIPNLSHPHNEILYWAVEGGILTLLGLLIAAASVLLRIKKYKPITRLALLALLAPIFIHTQLEYPFYHSMIHWVIFIILLFWIDQGCSSYKTCRTTETIDISLKISSLLIPFITTVYMLTVLQSNWVLTKFETTKSADLTILNQVTNPIVWAERLNWDRLITQLIIGLDTQNLTLIQPYITWSEKIIKRKPRPDYYKNLIILYQAIGQSQKAEDIRREAIFLFPHYHFETFNLPKTKNEQKTEVT